MSCHQGWRHSFQGHFHLYNLQTKAAPTWLTTAGEELLQNVVFAPVAAPSGVLAGFVRRNDIYIVDIVSKAGAVLIIVLE